MLEKTKTDLVLGLIVLGVSAVILFVWIPADIETGIFEKVRRRIEIGDTFAPVIAVSILALGGLLLVIEGARTPSDTRLAANNWIYSAVLLAVFVVTLTIMRWAGPLAVEIFGGPESTGYRVLRDTAPWKHIGFVFGGTFLVTTIICAVELKLTLRAFAIGLAATIVILLIYDLPFDDLLVPPNGDV